MDLKSVLLDKTGKRIASALEGLIVNNPSGVQSWKEVQQIVRLGLGPKMFPIGTQFVVNKETSVTAALGEHTVVSAVSVNEETFLAKKPIVGTGVDTFIYKNNAWRHEGQVVRIADWGLTVTGAAAEGDEIVVTEQYDRILWDVVDHSIESGKEAMTLLMHHVYNSKPFDAAEAFIYCPDGLAVGSYYFTVANRDYFPADNEVKYYFTLTKAVPKKGQLVFTGSYNTTLQGTTLRSFASASSPDIIETVTLSKSEISGATNLGVTDENNFMFNDQMRTYFGSNNYAESAVRQWINSNKPANAWWNPTNNFDRPVTYVNLPGLLHGMDADFLEVVSATEIPCATNRVFELQTWTKNAAYTVKDKFFLASSEEVGFAAKPVTQGEVFNFYEGAAKADRVKYDITNQTTARYWWTRSPSPSGSNSVRGVRTSGGGAGAGASGTGAVAAACKIL